MIVRPLPYVILFFSKFCDLFLTIFMFLSYKRCKAGKKAMPIRYTPTPEPSHIDVPAPLLFVPTPPRILTVPCHNIPEVIMHTRHPRSERQAKTQAITHTSHALAPTSAPRKSNKRKRENKEEAEGEGELERICHNMWCCFFLQPTTTTSTTPLTATTTRHPTTNPSPYHGEQPQPPNNDSTRTANAHEWIQGMTTATSDHAHYPKTSTHNPPTPTSHKNISLQPPANDDFHLVWDSYSIWYGIPIPSGRILPYHVGMRYHATWCCVQLQILAVTKSDRAPHDSWITTHSTQMVDLKWSTPPEALTILGMRENACTYILYKFEWCMAILCLWNCHSINQHNMTKITWCSVTFCDSEYYNTWYECGSALVFQSRNI